MIKINIWHGTRPLSQREHLLKGIRSFRTQSFRTQVSIRSYPSFNPFVPKPLIDSCLILTLPILFETLPARAREQMSIVAYDKVVELSSIRGTEKIMYIWNIIA